MEPVAPIEMRRVRRRSMKADIARAKKFVSISVDPKTMDAAWHAHIDQRHEGHYEDFSRLCYLCLALLRRRRRREQIEQYGR